MAFAAEASLVRRVNDATNGWAQGDVAALPLTTWIGSPAAPLTRHAANAATSQDSNVVTLAATAEAVVVIAQTCDVVRDAGTRSLVTVAQLVRLDGPAQREAQAGSRPRFVRVPGAGDDAFADLDLTYTMEKSVLVQSARTQGLRSDAERRGFGRAVGRFYSRFAFPDDLAVSMRGFVQRVRDKHARNSNEGRALEALEEIRITGSPSWSSTGIDVFLLFCPPTREEADEVRAPEKWDEQVDSWIRRAEPFGVIRSVEGAMVPLDELSGREYVDSDPLDLDYLSWAQTDAP